MFHASMLSPRQNCQLANLGFFIPNYLAFNCHSQNVPLFCYTHTHTHSHTHSHTYIFTRTLPLYLLPITNLVFLDSLKCSLGCYGQFQYWRALLDLSQINHLTYPTVSSSYPLVELKKSQDGMFQLFSDIPIETMIRKLGISCPNVFKGHILKNFGLAGHEQLSESDQGPHH